MRGTTELNGTQMILYEDRDILVCHKAAGLPVQSAGVGSKDMESILLNYLKEKQQAEPENRTEKKHSVRTDTQRIPYLGVVHRLDQPVEGIIVFAKNKKAAAGLSRQISGGMLKKVYLAVCCVDNVSDFGDKIQEPAKVSDKGYGSAPEGFFEAAEKEMKMNSKYMVEDKNIK